jgi:hypothetical protein
MKTLQEYLGIEKINPELNQQAILYLISNPKWGGHSNSRNIESENGKINGIMEYSDGFLSEFFSNTNPNYSVIQKLTN